MLFKKEDKLEGLIGARCEFKGDMTTEGTLRVDGKVIGNVKADWMIIGEGATIQGDISVRGIVIGGNLNGTVRAREVIDIRTTGHLIGDMHTKKLIIAEGGIFEGHSHFDKGETTVIDFPSKGVSQE
jgi:cytoskeletal protein CcmA (bactofilin family)